MSSELVAGKPVKRKTLGDTGWIQVTTAKGLRYYVNSKSKETTWTIPETVVLWQERHKAERQQQKAQESKQLQIAKELSHAEQLQSWVELTKQLIHTKNIPPIATYDRAQQRLCSDPGFLCCPPERRQEVFELAKKAILTRDLGAHNILAAFEERLTLLKNRKLIRHDHTPEDVLESYFKDEKWLGIQKNEKTREMLIQSIREAQEILSLELENLMPQFDELLRRYFEKYVTYQGNLRSPKNNVHELLQNNDFVLGFVTEESLDEFKAFVQELPTDEKDTLIWGKFLISLDPNLINELLVDSWQHWCQIMWSSAGDANVENSPCVFKR
eukprot:Gregarina_sp_Poly_1__2029@NODE_1532_length_3918_cov_126_566346_g1011_i0_p2_GENE_NODE_1532_length_3918_cov_126_566346_g1011_i0NODE_1532_length_3918_cov_126_566346_g1011_i0_p2_ORF_typecomplete_len328_score59_20WW/PF00397_26/1_4e06FF/PF01846_19/0_65FF/PF01846_19/6e02FF/PF01846_19/5_1e03_NODE_1532_length_3918_cov_126_566346_g1011_i025293512